MKATQKTIQEHNIGLILKYIKEEIGITRIKLSKLTGLSKSSVSNIVNALIKKSVIWEDGKIESEFGKKPTKLRFNKDYRYILAIQIEQDNITIVLSNLNGEFIYRIEEKPYPKNNRNEILECIFSLVNKILINSKQIMNKILVISIGTHGVVNPQNNITTNAPYIEGWDGINLVDIFKKKYKKDIILNNSINLGSIGEQWINYKKIRNLVYIDISFGIGAGIIINNELVVGCTGTMGEISYLPILNHYNYNDLIKNTSELGLFESQVDIAGITNTVKKRLKNLKELKIGTINKQFDEIAFDDICLYYKNGVAEIREIIDNEIIKILALGIASIITIIDTELIILNGYIFKLGEIFFKKLKKEVSDIIPFKPKIIQSKLGNESHIMGAIKKGIDYSNNELYSNFLTIK